MNSKVRFYILIAPFILFQGCNKLEDRIIPPPLSPWVVYGSLTDRDGNTYKTIEIGTQTWMIQNLKTTRYNDGTSIPLVNDPVSWSNLSTPGYCWQEYDPAYRVTYGLLYNWYAVNTGKLCPAGWHVPGENDWDRLTNYLGGMNIAGGKLKETGFRHWNSPNTGATNESYFRAFPGGIRRNGTDALFSDLREAGYWWTTASGGDWGACRLLYYNSDHIQKSISSKNCGLSVRCVSNQ